MTGGSAAGQASGTPPTAQLVLSVTDARNMVPDFDGNPSNLRRFIDCCDLVFSTTRSESDNLLFFNLLKTKLTGPAYDLLKFSTITTWDELKKKLITQFQQDRPRVAILGELMRLRQDLKESVDEFVQRINKLLSELNNATYNCAGDDQARVYLYQENEQNAIRALEDGLRNDQLKVLAKSKGETSLKNLVSFIGGHAYRIEQAQNRSFNASRDSKSCEVCGKRGHDKSTCFRNRTIPSFRPQSTQIKREVNRLVCQYCLKPNHHRNDCRIRMRDEETRRAGNNFSNSRQLPGTSRAFNTHKPSQATPVRQVRWSNLSESNPENLSLREEYDGHSARLITQAVVHPNPENFQLESQ